MNKNRHQIAKSLIPAGAHTYSKADDQYSANAPRFFVKGSGAYCEDETGKKYLDYGMGLMAVSLGHAYPKVNEALMQNLANGNVFTRPSLLEGELAEKLVNLIPCAEMVKFAKNGSDVNSAAVRLARYYTGRDLVVRCAEQPFYSFDDWFIGSTSRKGGIPDNIQKDTLRFHYNNIESLRQLFEEQPGSIACVIMEAATFQAPKLGFLEEVRQLCETHKSLLIFDEVITGFRWDIQGAQHYYEVTPHLATFGKGMANGFSCSALVGQKDIMQAGNMGGDVFLLSCTYGAETFGLSAALTTIRIMEEENVIQHAWDYGERLIHFVQKKIQQHGLQDQLEIEGYGCRPNLIFRENGTFSYPLKTLFIQEMLRNQVLMERISIAYCHRNKEWEQTKKALEHTFNVMQEAIEKDRIMEYLEGPPVRPVFTY